MPDRQVDFLLIGGGLASANCARWLREEGADGSILLVGREPDPPYNRPPCSKGYLQGQESREDTWFRPREWWAEHDVELLTRTSVMKLDTGERVAKLSTKDEVAFDKALLATGANVRRLNVDGCELEQIHYLRTLGNTDAIRADAQDAEHVVLIGGSYIGTEVAASLTAMGKRCTIVMQEPVTLSRTFGERVGRFFQGVLEEHGVEIVGEDELARFEGEGEHVQRVHTKAGREIAADVVVIGAGVLPDVTLARNAGLELGERGGVKTSAQLESSVPGIYAAGDMAEFDSPLHGGHARIEHWDVAFNQGKTAALNMLGRDRPHDVVPYFFSDLADWSSMEYVGLGGAWEDEVVRGSLEDGEFTVWYLSGGRVVGALTVGRSDDLEAARRLIAERVDVGERREELADPSSDLSAPPPPPPFARPPPAGGWGAAASESALWRGRRGGGGGGAWGRAACGFCLPSALGAGAPPPGEGRRAVGGRPLATARERQLVHDLLEAGAVEPHALGAGNQLAPVDRVALAQVDEHVGDADDLRDALGVGVVVVLDAGREMLGEAPAPRDDAAGEGVVDAQQRALAGHALLGAVPLAVEALGIAREGLAEDEAADVVQECRDEELVAVLPPDLGGEALGGALRGDGMEAEALGRVVPARDALEEVDDRDPVGQGADALAAQDADGARDVGDRLGRRVRGPVGRAQERDDERDVGLDGADDVAREGVLALEEAHEPALGARECGQPVEPLERLGEPMMRPPGTAGALLRGRLGRHSAPALGPAVLACEPAVPFGT